ncbi:MAG TPA: ABC transporter substrate-binding protein [Steroidobacteraceae bacterium]|nr:ABC transporter substrate-binding protein [Steroidobacteraceae bacterium]
MLTITLVVLLGFGAAAVARAAPLPRVVSINPCVDAVLVRVARPEQILGISHYSQDPRATSIPLETARRFRATSGTAEEVVALAPDLVMSGPHVAPSTIFALERMNIRILKFSVPESVAESERQIRQIAAVVGAPERGEQIVRAIERALVAASPRDERRVSAVIWQNGGMVPGKGSLADQLLQLTGYRNFSAEYGLAKWDVLPLEYLIASPPEVVLSVATDGADRDRMLGHPAVRALSERVPFHTYPFRLLQCGGPTIIDAVARLAEVRRELEARQ